MTESCKYVVVAKSRQLTMLSHANYELSHACPNNADNRYMARPMLKPSPHKMPRRLPSAVDPMCCPAPRPSALDG